MATGFLTAADTTSTTIFQLIKTRKQTTSEQYPHLISSKLHLAFSLSPFSSCSSKFTALPYSCLKYHANLPVRRCHVTACLSSSAPSTSTRLYVSGLSFRTTEESLRNAFQQFGQLVEVHLVMDKIANRPRGFAFLRYSTEDESMKAIEGMHGKFLDGRVIFVEVAKPRSQVQKNKPDTR